MNPAKSSTKRPSVASRDGVAPILLDLPHSGRVGLSSPEGVPHVIAEKFRYDSADALAALGFGCDAAVPEMSGFHDLVAEFNLSAVSNDLARVYVDVNRAKTDVSGLACEGADPYAHHSGVIWARTIPQRVDLSQPLADLERLVDERTEPLLRAPLTAAEFAALMAEIYDPYHDALRRQHARIVAAHGRVVHLALHSLAPVGITTVRGGYVCGSPAARGPYYPAGNTLPDIILIHNDFRAADRTVVDRVRRAFESAGLRVEDGRGAFVGANGVTGLYGDPANGRHVIGIEHVGHETEPRRHLGDATVDVAKARAFRAAYRAAVAALLA